VSAKAQPTFRVSKGLVDGEFLSQSVWPGKSNPEDEVINVQLRKND